MTLTNLDSPQGCIEELAEVNREFATFGWAWAEAAGDLKEKVKRQERLHGAALRGLEGAKLTVPEKKAAASAAVEEMAPGLAEEIERLENVVERHKTYFESLAKRASGAQSILNYHREESKLGNYVRSA